MRGIKRFSLVLMLMSVTACAPVVYDATYRSPAGHVSVQTNYVRPVYRHAPTHRTIRPIEVTLYADNSYQGVYFSPIRLIIADNQYVKIPAKDRRGRNTRIYAHYYQKNLHFDVDRSCKGIQGSSRYSYDNRWDKGHRYTSINAGRDYDLTGLRLHIQNAPGNEYQTNQINPPKGYKEKGNVRSNGKKRLTKQNVVKHPLENNGKQVAVRKKLHQVNSRAARPVEHFTKNELKLITEMPLSNDNAPNMAYGKATKKAKSPVIVEKINKHEQSKRFTKVSPKSVDKKLVQRLTQKSVKLVDSQNKGKGKTQKFINAKTENSSVKASEKSGRTKVKPGKDKKTERVEERDDQLW